VSKKAKEVHMLTSLVATALALSPLVAVVVLLQLVAWRDRRRQAAVARQITVTDAIGRELGAVVAPTVTPPWWGPWQLRMAVPLARPVMVARILAITERALARDEETRAARWEIVLTPQTEPPRPASVTRLRHAA
jgi:hypothetical protein